MTDFTPHQQKIIKRYYDNIENSSFQRLEELVTDLYLAEGKKRAQCWKRAAAAMEKLNVPQYRIDLIVSLDNPVLIVKLLEELRKRH
ncbi:MAG: hypothetical protein Q4D62_13500 [Planctomycetia bacterium]|nr:hypothetical protein [Planctomycetia bacterium]